MTFFDFNKTFPTRQSAIDCSIHTRYNDKLTRPRYGATMYVYGYKNRSKVFKRAACNNTLLPFANTIFEKSSTDTRE
jgi:hypothetical protein